MTLREFMKLERIGVSALARLIKHPQSTTSSWVNGKRIPTKDGMKRIYIATAGRVQPNDFFELSNNE